MVSRMDMESTTGLTVVSLKGFSGMDYGMGREYGRKVVVTLTDTTASGSMIRNAGMECTHGYLATLTKGAILMTYDMVTVRCIGLTVASTKGIGRKGSRTGKES